MQDLTNSVWALGALSAAAGSGLLRQVRTQGGTVEDLAAHASLPPAIARRLLDVLVALGFAVRDNGAYTGAPALQAIAADPEAAERVEAEIQNALLQSADLAARGRRRGELDLAGWRHEDPDILRTQGISSAGAVPALADRAFPSLGDLQERIDRPGAAALDVGTGVGAIAIGLCSRFPELRVVALEPAPAPYAEAQRNIAAAGLQNRIELRAQRVEDLADTACFDFAFLPIVFLPTETMRAGLAAVRDALRPGGWVLMGSLGSPGDDLAPAISRMQATLWGSEALDPETVGHIAEEIGYDEVRFFPGPPGRLIPIAARRG